MRLAVSHNTSYAYAASVSRSTQYIRLTPLSSRRQTVYHWELDLPANSSRLQDAYGNIVHVMTLDKPHDGIAIRARGMVDIADGEDDAGTRINPMYFLRETRLTAADAGLRAYAEGFAGYGNTVALLEALMQDLRAQMPYTPGSTHVSEPAAESFAKHQGVCQDHAHVFIACCRVLGVPARYVSGYLHSDEAEGHLASHAWVEAWVDGHWQTVDVTNSLLRPERHLKLAIGLDYLEACPVRGVRWGGNNECLTAHAAVSLVEASTAMDQ